MNRNLVTAAVAATTLLAPLAGHAQTTTQTFKGNGATGFGGPVGNGSLTVSSAANGDLTFSLAPSGGNLGGNDLVLYIDSAPGAPGGFANNSTFQDTGDGGRTSISGYQGGGNNNINNGNPSRSLVTFAPGFRADYAISFEDTFAGLFNLTSGATGGSFTYVTGAGQSGTGPYTLTIPASAIGDTAGEAFDIEGTLIATSAYRSNETIGASTTTVDPNNPGAAPNAGYNGSVTFTSFNTVNPAPEPSGVASLLIGVAVLGGAFVARRRRTTN